MAAALLLALAGVSLASAATPTKVVGNPKNGKKLFIAHDCGSCHIMAAANQFNGSGAGPDLDTTKKTYAQIVANITNGGRGMTGYKHSLTTSQIADLAAFVYTTAHSTHA
jgi:mono/diheme cytochrome c family protein